MKLKQLRNPRLVMHRAANLVGPYFQNITGNRRIATPGFQYGPNGALSSQVYAEDGFGTGNELLENRALDTDVANSGWTNVLPGTDQMQTSGGKLFIYAGGGDWASTYVNDQGVANGILSADITVNSGSANAEDYIGIIGRYGDANNFLRAYYVYSLGHKIVLDRRIAGTYSNVQLVDITPTFSETYELRMELNGSSVKVYWDDVELIDYTDNDHASNTKMGVWMQVIAPHQDNSMDNYKFRSL